MRKLAFAALAAFVVACTPPAPAPDVRPLADGETRIDGVVTLVEDGGYPQFTVTVQPETGEPLALYLNAESGADLNTQQPGSFSGQTVTAYYTTADDPLLIALQSSNGAPIVTPDGPALANDDQTITGVLSGADAVTNSDLPDIVTVTDAQGAAHNFEYYITEAMVAANGQQVTARYRPGVRHEITLLHPTGAAQPQD
jgi:hypothetical protein